MTIVSKTEQFTDTELAQLTINTIRGLAMDGVQRAKSGHPGMPMGCAPMAYVLWTRFMRHNPNDPLWPNRDRFILSAGHGSMLLYSLLHLSGYDMPLDELKRFRQWGSKTPGHPEYHPAGGIETTTGPLGQGFATGVGMAIAERFLAAHFNRPGFSVIDHNIYAIVSDGDLMEGVSHEAASLAGHLGLGKLIYLYDDNEISIDGSTDLSFTEDVGRRFEAYNWHVQYVDDGNDLDALQHALKAARAVTEKPSLIVTRTIIGYGSPNKQGTSKSHGEPLGEEEVVLAKRNLGLPDDELFVVPDEVYDHMRHEVQVRGERDQAEWNSLWSEYARAYPDLAEKLKSWLDGDLPEGWDKELPLFQAGEKLATRAASGKVINAVAPVMEYLVGGSADLTPSNNTLVKGRADFQKETPAGGYFRFGVREHAMAAACNGMALHGGVRPYCATFFVFSDYLRPALRLSALMSAPVIYVFTHDSIGIGEDGPTHQPVEHMMTLRAIPNLTVIRPADATETVEAWKTAIHHKHGPVALLLTRQALPVLDREKLAPADGLQKGAYILSDSEGIPDIILIASGSEVQHAVDAADVLRKEGVAVRVVSMPSWELFESQDQAYKNHVLPPTVTCRLAIEAGVTLGWERYVGTEGRVIGIDRFGESAPVSVVMEKFGFSSENVQVQAREMLKNAAADR